MKLCEMKAPATSEGVTGASRPDHPHDESSPCGLCLGPGSVYPLVFALLSTSSSQEFKLCALSSDFYGPQVTNQTFYPYPDDLVIVTKGWCCAWRRRVVEAGAHPADLTRAVHDNLRNLRVEALDVVNLRVGGIHEPNQGSIEEQFATLAELRRQGLIRQLGLSNVTSHQLKQARNIAEVVCVQNHYNLVHRDDDSLVDELAGSGVAYVPFFPLGGFTRLQSSTLSEVATQLGTTQMQTALAWLLHRAPNILLIPGTSSIGHLHENLATAELVLPDEVLARLNAINKRDVR